MPYQCPAVQLTHVSRSADFLQPLSNSVRDGALRAGSIGSRAHIGGGKSEAECRRPKCACYRNRVIETREFACSSRSKTVSIHAAITGPELKQDVVADIGDHRGCGNIGSGASSFHSRIRESAATNGRETNFSAHRNDHVPKRPALRVVGRMNWAVSTAVEILRVRLLAPSSTTRGIESAPGVAYYHQ